MSAQANQGLTNFLALDCEFVVAGRNRKESVARASLVNCYGQCVYDSYVKPTGKVVNYRTHITGISKRHLANAQSHHKVKHAIADMIKGRILVGHSVINDLKKLGLSHPDWNIRDTSTFEPYIQIAEGRTPGLKFLAKKILDIDIQNGAHSSVEDACAAMKLYLKVDTLWEALLEVESDSDECSGYEESTDDDDEYYD